MPLKGFVCPPGGEEQGRKNEIEYCLGKCANPCVAPPLLAAMYKAEVGNYHQLDYISASLLAGDDCARKTYFERFEPFYDAPKKRFWPFRGQHAHSICEGASDLLRPYGWLQEIQMSTQLNYDLPAPVFENGAFTGRFDETESLVITVRGTCDAYNPLTRTLADMKSMADLKAQYMITGEPPSYFRKEYTFSPNLSDSWVWQFNIYRWLIARTRISPEVKAEFEARGTPLRGRTYPAPTKLWVQGISMMEIPRSGASYTFRVPGQRGQSTYDIDPVPVLPMQEIENYVRPKALAWYRVLKLGMRAPIVRETAKWMCKACAFNGELIPGERCHPTAERAGKVAEAPPDTGV